MRITIIESEIKEAIVAFVASQLTIKEGQEITVDFKATRGEDGATAEINIVTPSEEEAPVVNTTPVRRPRKTAEATVTPAVEEDKTNQVEPKEATEEVQEVVGNHPEPTAEKAPEEAPVEQTELGETVEEQAESTPAPKTGSLFSQLKRPVND